MTTIDLTRETHIGRDWPKSLALLFVCVGMIAISWYGVRMEPDGIPDHRLHSASFLMLPFFSVFSAVLLVRLAVPWGAPIRIGPDGFADLRAGHGVIPWSEVTNVVRRGDYVSLTLRRGFAQGYRLSLTQKLLKARRRSAGPSHLLVVDWCLRTTTADLIALITAYRAGSHEIPDPATLANS